MLNCELIYNRKQRGEIQVYLRCILEQAKTVGGCKRLAYLLLKLFKRLTKHE